MISRRSKRSKLRRPSTVRPTQRRRSGKRVSGVQLPWKTLLAASVSLVALAGGGYLAAQDMSKARADEFGCYEQTEALSQTVVLVDSSEPRFDTVQRRDLLTAFGDLFKNDLTFNEQLTLIATDASRIGTVPNPVVTRCGPPRSQDDLERVGAARATDAFLDRQADQIFDLEFQPHLDNVFAANPPDSQRQRAESPILEQIQSISRLRAFSSEAVSKRLIVVSDMLQNTPDAQFCHMQGHLPGFESFQQQLYFERVEPRSLSGADVTVYMLVRGVLGQPPYPYCTEDELVRFWQAYFANAGAGSVDFIRLRQGAYAASGQ